MFVPIQDDNPLRHIKRPYVTWGLVALTCLVYLLETSGVPQSVIASFAIIPTELLRSAGAAVQVIGAGNAVAVPEPYTLVSYMFLHADIAHLLGNMLFLWVFGDNVEDALGHLGFGVFYLVCGVAGGLAHALMLPASDDPLIGASGAVAGVITGYLLLYPRVLVWVLVLRFIPIRITAAFALGAWVLTQFAMLALPYIVPGLGVEPISWWAHIGGIMAGGLIILLVRPTAGRDATG